MTIEKPLPSQEYLRECFHYEPTTGRLIWRARPRSHFPSDRAWKAWNYQWPGDCAGKTNDKGYLRVPIGNTQDYAAAARVIFKWMTGTDPPLFIDHRDGDPTNNRWTNLREATRAQNTVNVGDRPLRGVHQLPSGRFEARPSKDGEYIYLGIFPTAEAAHAAYLEAKRGFWGEFVRGS